MAESRLYRYKGVLDPLDRLSEVMYGLIMILSITGSFSVANGGRVEVRSMLVSAFGCSVAWGVVDAVMYLVSRLSERANDNRVVRLLRESNDADESRCLISSALPPAIGPIVSTAKWEHLQHLVHEIPEPPLRAHLTRNDLLGSIAIFMVAFSATVPVVIPFVLIADSNVALRTSNAVAVLMLFLMGLWLGRYIGYSPLRVALGAVLLGAALVVITVALGG